jgi:hypothetical protein
MIHDDEDAGFVSCTNCGETVLRGWMRGIPFELDLKPLSAVEQFAHRMIGWEMYTVRMRPGGKWWIDQWCISRALGAQSLGRAHTIQRQHACDVLRWHR